MLEKHRNMCSPIVVISPKKYWLIRNIGRDIPQAPMVELLASQENYQIFTQNLQISMVVGLVPLTYATLEHHQSPHVFVVAKLMPFVQKTIVSTNYHNTCLVISTCYGACYNQ